MYPFRKLSVWQRAHSLTLSVHEVTERGSRGRYVSLVNQMRRASMSIPANIAEGTGQVTAAKFARYLTIALGSARELDYQVLVAHDLGLLHSSDYARLDARVDQVCRMLAALRLRVLQRTPRPAPGDDQIRSASTGRIRHPASDFRHPLSD